MSGEVAETDSIFVTRPPESAVAWHRLSCAHARAQRWQSAQECARKALSLSPTHPSFALHYGRCLLATGHRPQALDVANAVAAMRLDRADWNDALGTLLTHCEDPTRARPFFERAVALDPQNSLYLYNLATAQRMTGDVAGAETSLNRAITIEPSDIRAYFTRSDLRMQTPELNHVDELVQLLNQGVKYPREEILLCFALAKELEDLARYSESFSYLKRGCDLQRRQLKYDVAEDVATIDSVIERHNRAAIQRTGECLGEKCIFVVGLPRSGTTLVERIVSSHSTVVSTGESHAFSSEAMKAVQRATGLREVRKLDFVEEALKVDPTTLGNAYLEAARPQTASRQRFVDKTPLNYLYMGLIRRALPRARFIALVREPMDSCYAMYKTLFANAYPFSYNLSDLGHYYAAWHRLMLHWKSEFDESLLFVQYEDLVANQEAVSRQLIAHCGLPWEAGCLEFQDNRTAVTTASSVQVRRPIYSASVDKWRCYEVQLQELARVLKHYEPTEGWSLESSLATA
jgi:tetratricopeptide (TPR) repeat protein